MAIRRSPSHCALTRLRVSLRPCRLYSPRFWYPKRRAAVGKSVLTSTYCLSLFLAPSTHLTGAGSGPSGLLTFVTGLIIGVLTIAVAVAIALWQRIIQLHDRAAEREQENARRREQAAHEARISRRQAWQAEYEDIRKLLDCGETLAYRVRHDGPYDVARMAVLDIATFRMNAERLAERGVVQLRDPLLQLARKADELAQCAIPDEIGLTVALSRSEMSNGMDLHRVARLAVLQDRAAQDLAHQIASAWRVLREEWGS
jgi:hypothetical protein